MPRRRNGTTKRAACARYKDRYLKLRRSDPCRAAEHAGQAEDSRCAWTRQARRQIQSTYERCNKVGPSKRDLEILFPRG